VAWDYERFVVISDFFADISGHGRDLQPHFLLAATAEELQPPGAVIWAIKGAECKNSTKAYKFLEKIHP